MARFTIIRCRKLKENVAEFDVQLLSNGIREGHTFSFRSVYKHKEFQVTSVRQFPTHTTLVCAGSLDYDDEITSITLDTVPTLAERPVIPLPPDVVERIQLVFPNAVEPIARRLLDLRHEGPDFIGDTGIRGIVWCAWRYPETSLEGWIEHAQQDWRNIIVAAGRSFGPFCDEDFSATSRVAMS